MSEEREGMMIDNLFDVKYEYDCVNGMFSG